MLHVSGRGPGPEEAELLGPDEKVVEARNQSFGTLRRSRRGP
jgi:hypothetical protein